MSFSDEVNNAISCFFFGEAIQIEGKYSTSLINRFCLLFYRLAAIDELHLVKSSLSNDLSLFVTYLSSGLENSVEQHQKLRQWLSSENSIENALLKKLDVLNIEQKKKIFTILWDNIT